MNSYSKQLIDDEDIASVVEALKSPYLTGGNLVEKFQEDLAKYLGVKYCIVFSSGTAALHGAYVAAGLKEGDEFITTPLTFVATANAGLYLGGKVKFADTNYQGQISLKNIEKLINKKTKLIVPVDYAGNPCQIEEIVKLAKEKAVTVVEDASHALGSEINRKKIGTFADMTVFSFHPVKPITTFEGGAVVTNNKEFAEKLVRFRSHGIVKKSLWNQDMVELGYNYRLSDVACALGISQLKKLDFFTKKREEIASFYDEALKDIVGITTIKLPVEHKSSRHLYPILLDRDMLCSKENIYTELQEKGVGVQVHYKPVHKHSFYKKFIKESFPIAEEFYKSEISIPCHQGLTMEDAKKVVDILKEVIEKNRGCKI